MIGLNRKYIQIYVIVVMNMLQINIVEAKGLPTLMFGSKLTSSYLHDSNIHRTHTGEISDNLLEVKPEVKFTARNNMGSVKTEYDGTFTRYVNNNLSDFIDTNLSVDAVSNQDKSVSFNSKVLYKIENESRGNVDISDEVTNIEYATYAQYLVFGFDLQNSSKDTHLEGRVTTIERKFDDASLDQLDSDYISYRLQASYKPTSRTDVFIAGERATYTYTQSDILTPDNLEYKYLVGGTWKATGKTSGIFELGLQTKYLDASSSQKYTSIYTKVKMNWIRSSKSQFSFILKRQANDNPSGNGKFAVVNSLEVNWIQKFTHKLYSKLIAESSINRSNEEDNATDVQFELSPSLIYGLTRKLELIGNFTYKTRNSSISDSDYYQSNVGVTYKMNRIFEMSVMSLLEKRTATLDSLNYDLMVTSVSFKLKY